MLAPAKVEFEAIRRNKVYEEVARQIQNHILEHLKPGDVLPPERELAQRFGVSRGSVRDAIRSLELVGLLEPRQGMGTVVCEPSAEALASPLAAVLVQKRKLVGELLDVRKIIEPPLARRAALHATAAQIEEMEQILARQGEKVERGEMAVEEDSEFHYRIALAADNSVMLRMVDVLMDMLRETRRRSLQTSGRPQKSLASHRRILAALKRHDPVASESAMLRHLEEVEHIVLPKH
ncbi:MAG TPA: FadR/GntR family transcriptional regulator [Terriglobales bacterium]|nr:FadR/GntR family transcriptional regulator [Terriglobales bacterium]